MNANGNGVPPSTIRRPNTPSRGEPIPKPGNPPGGVPPYLKPIPFNTRDIEAALNRAIEAESPRLSRILYSTWNAQADAVKYQEIRNAVRDGEFSQGVFDRWRMTYAESIATAYAPILADVAISAGGQMMEAFVQVSGRPLSYPLFRQSVDDWTRRRAGELAVNLSTEQRKAVRAIMTELGSRQALNPKEVARYLRPALGLTDKAAGRVASYREALLADGVSARRAEHLTQNYIGRLERIRAERVARTELAFAYNGAHQTAAEVAAESGAVRDVRKRLVVANGPRLCAFCSAVASAQPPGGIRFNESFPGMTERMPNALAPPLHPNCRCTVEVFVDVW